MTYSHTIDSYIDTACHSGTQDAYTALFDFIKGREIYFNLSDEGNIQLFSNNDFVENTPGIICYSASNDHRLRKPYASMTWEEALMMLVNFPQEILLVLQSTSGEWVGISQDTANSILMGNTDNSDLNDIAIRASASQRDEDYYKFFISAYNRPVFFPIDEEDGHTKVAVAADNLKVIVFFLTPSSEFTLHTTLWQEGLKLALADQTIDGIIVQTESKENIAISREKITQLLEIYDEWNSKSNE